MIEDIVNQLRDRAYSGIGVDRLCEAAANEIDRLRNGAVRGCESVQSATNHDAAPAAKANAESVAPQPTAGDRSGNPTSHSGTGKHPAPPCVETDGFSHDSRTGQINRTPECESPRRECWESPLRDVTQLDNSRAAGGPEHPISEAQIDALECVVEDGRIVGMGVYGHLRSLLVRLRPEWESDRPQPVKDDLSDRPKPISDKRLAALEELSALDQELELKHGIAGNPMINAQQRKAAKTDTTRPRNGTPAEGSVQGERSVPDSRNANEPVAWAAYCDGVYDSSFCGSFDAKNEAAEWCNELRFEDGRDWIAVPLYRQPQTTLTDAEREAVVWAVFEFDGVRPDNGKAAERAATLRGLLARLS